MIIFLWKIAESLVHGYSIDFLRNGRLGRSAIPKPIVKSSPTAIQRARESSLSVNGCRLFNLLPTEIRNMQGCTVEVFKGALDRFLANVPDQPTIN